MEYKPPKKNILYKFITINCSCIYGHMYSKIVNMFYDIYWNTLKIFKNKSMKKLESFLPEYYVGWFSKDLYSSLIVKKSKKDKILIYKLCRKIYINYFQFKNIEDIIDIISKELFDYCYRIKFSSGDSKYCFSLGGCNFSKYNIRKILQNNIKKNLIIYKANLCMILKIRPKDYTDYSDDYKIKYDLLIDDVYFYKHTVKPILCIIHNIYVSKYKKNKHLYTEEDIVKKPKIYLPII